MTHTDKHKQYSLGDFTPKSMPAYWASVTLGLWERWNTNVKRCKEIEITTLKYVKGEECYPSTALSFLLLFERPRGHFWSLLRWAKCQRFIKDRSLRLTSSDAFIQKGQQTRKPSSLNHF